MGSKRTTITRRKAILAGLSLAALPLRVAAQTKTVLKMGTLGSTEYFYYKGAKQMADEVAAKTGGSVEIQVFPNQQLGNERDMIEGMQLGTIDLAVINTPLLAGFDPRFQLFDMPFLFNNWDHVNKVLSSPIGEDLKKSLETKQLKAFAFSTAGFRHVLNYKRPIRTPEDLSGLKIRTLDNPVHVAIMNAMGANATPMQYSEVATALRQHTVDGLELADCRHGDGKVLRDQQIPVPHRSRVYRRDLPDGHEALPEPAGRPAGDYHGRRRDRRKYRDQIA